MNTREAHSVSVRTRTPETLECVLYVTTPCISDLSLTVTASRSLRYVRTIDHDFQTIRPLQSPGVVIVERSEEGQLRGLSHS